MAIIKLSAIERRRVSAFFTCLVLAVFAWIFTVLSNPYTYTVKGVLNFRNTPQKRAFHSLQSDTVNVNVNGTGWEMLFAKMERDTRSISVDLHALENKSFVVLSSQIMQINNGKDITQPVTGFFPDTLYFDFSNRREKRVPVTLVTSIKYQHQFAQSGNITLKPGYVILNGPADVIDKITEWKSDTLKMDSLGETTTATVALRSPSEGNISIYPRNVQVTIPVDEFTEKTVSVPVKLVNNHNYYDVKIFPMKVDITFTTSLTHFAQTDDDFFEATADLDLWRQHGYKVLPVTLTKTPQFGKIVKIEPRNIDFIVKK
jgi:YbbR domain-containing protein